MDIKHIKMGNAGLVDPLNDFSLEIRGQSAPIQGRRLETLRRIGAGAAGKLADHTAVNAPGVGPAVATDGFVTTKEVELLKQQSDSAQLPLLEKLMSRPESQPVQLAPAVRVIRREVQGKYDPTWVGLDELPGGFKQMAQRVLDTLDNKLSEERGSEEHDYAYEKMISQDVLRRFLDLSDLELAAFEPDGPKVGASGQRAVAEKLLRHISAEELVRETEPNNPRPAVSRFPVQGADVKLVTTPVPDYERTGRNTYHNLNRVLEVKVPPGHTVLLNVQSPASGQLNMAELVLTPSKDGLSQELPYLPGAV
ncbi:MAG: hypothetical protein KC933_05805 [Myxococcales bacterium]|nr:hypothetical protein [Myxococcales bacterium]